MTNKPITLRVLGLPDGVTVADVVVKPDQKDVELELKAMPTARLGAFQVAPLALIDNNPNVQI